MLPIFRVFVGIWAGLNAVDDLSVLFRLGRLGLALLPGSASLSTMCDICDDVMVDLLKGAEGLQSLPCSWACLKVPECVAMCTNVKEFSQNSSRFPCLAAGYCEDSSKADWDEQCHMAPIFRCVPSRLCARRRNGFRFSCVLKPGYGRWMGMQQAVSDNFGALAAALWDQPRCGEPGAHPTYCIAKPRGLGAVADSAGKVLSLGYGMLSTVHALETPGGDDDRQWLTFWVIIALLSVLESFAAVLLTAVPHYYEAKLLLLAWLLFGSGAEKLYRRVRRFLFQLEQRWTLLGALLGDRADRIAADQLASLPATLVASAITLAAAREESETQTAARDLCLTPWGSQTGAGANLRLGFSAGSTASPNQARVQPGVQAEALRRQLVQFQGEGEVEGTGPAAIHHRFLQRDSSLPDMQVSRPLVDARALSKLSRPSRSDPTLLLVRPLLEERLRVAARGLAWDVKGIPAGEGEEVEVEPSADSSNDSSVFTHSCVNTPNEEALRLTYQYLMTADGSAALAGLQLPEAERSALMQRAAEDASFQPRFLHIFLIGTPGCPAGELPLMDKSLDSYCVARLEDEHGVLYPLGGVRSRVAYRSTRPAWREGLELPLRGGFIGADGIFRNTAAARTKLIVEVYDDNLGVWSMTLAILHAVATSLAVALVAAYAGGVMDQWSKSRLTLVYATGGALPLAIFLLTVAHTWLNADDELVGRTAPVPLDMLMDQRTYGLSLKLKDGSGDRRNGAGKRGGLQISLTLSER